MNKKVITALVMSASLGAMAHAQADDSESKLEAKPYGWFLPKFGYATAGLKTFSTQTEIAPTAVASQRLPTSMTVNGTNTAYDPSQDSYGRGNWQIGQSRFGVKFNSGPQLSAKLEIDFFNNNDSEPEYSLLAPRLRIASINYKFSDDLSMMAGQDWDIFNGGVNSITYNPVGNFYQAGNAGFLRQQFALKMGADQGMSLTAALGLPAKNDNAAGTIPVTDGASEMSAIPTIALNLSLRDNDEEVSGISAIAGRVVFAGGTVGSDSHLAYGVSAFTAKNLAPTFKLRAKIYYGQNLSNLNMLTLSNGAGLNSKSSAYDFGEFGGFLSTWTGLTDKLGLILSAGIASSTTTSTMGPLLTSSASSVLTSNFKFEGGFDYALTKNLKSFVEVSYFSSGYYEGKAPTSANTYGAEFVDLGFKLDLI